MQPWHILGKRREGMVAHVTRQLINHYQYTEGCPSVADQYNIIWHTFAKINADLLSIVLKNYDYIVSDYHKTSNISPTFVGKIINDQSDVVRA